MRFIPVGQVVAAHGLRGEIRLRYYNEGAPLMEYPSFFVDDAGGKTELKPAGVRPGKAQYIVKFKGLDTIGDVSFLLGKEVFVREEDLAPLEEDEYYDYQLIGLSAVTEKGRKIGIVKEVMHTKASDILVVAGDSEVLVPMTEDHITAVDIEGGVVHVREDGLVE